MTPQTSRPDRDSVVGIATTVVLLASGAIHLIPVAGVLGRSAIEGLYGVTAADGDVAILLQHRAVLFGLLGMATVIAAVTRRHRTELLVANLVSVATFVVLAVAHGDVSPEIRRVAVVDAALAPFIVVTLTARLRRPRPAPNDEMPAELVG